MQLKTRLPITALRPDLLRSVRQARLQRFSLLPTSAIRQGSKRQQSMKCSLHKHGSTGASAKAEHFSAYVGTYP